MGVAPLPPPPTEMYDNRLVISPFHGSLYNAANSPPRSFMAHQQTHAFELQRLVRVTIEKINVINTASSVVYKPRLTPLRNRLLLKNTLEKNIREIKLVEERCAMLQQHQRAAQQAAPPPPQRREWPRSAEHAAELANRGGNGAGYSYDQAVPHQNNRQQPPMNGGFPARKSAGQHVYSSVPLGAAGNQGGSYGHSPKHAVHAF